MRIIAGVARGRPLKGPKGPGLRPTSDKVKESLFSIIATSISGARVLDLFSGTGALSLEAISRGATHALMVDFGRESLALARVNTASLAFDSAVSILPCRIDAKISQRLGQHAPFDLAFADPPYAAVTPAEILAWVDHRLFAPGALFVLEHDRRSDAPLSANGYVRIDQRKFGDTVVSFYRCEASGSEDDSVACGDQEANEGGEAEVKLPSEKPIDS